MASNKPATTTTTQTKSPWSPASGNLQTVQGNASEIAGNLENWVPQYSGTTMQGIGGLENAAGNLSDSYGTMTRDALGQIVPQSTAGFGTGLGQLQQVASGGYINNNPYFEDALNRGATDITNRVNGVFAGAGRYGSAAHTGALTRELGNMEAQARFGQYNTERSAQDAAAGRLQAGGFQGAGMSGQYDNAELQRQLLPAQLQLQAGALRDQQALTEQTAPMRSTEWLNQMSLPAAQAFGSQTGTSQTVQPTNPWTQALGIGQMGLGLLTGGASGGLIGAGTGLLNYFNKA